MRLVFHRLAGWSCAAALALLIMLVGAAFAPGAEAHPGHGHAGMHEALPESSSSATIGAERAKPESSIFMMWREIARAADGDDFGSGIGCCACLACTACCAVLGASSVAGTIVAAAMSTAPALQRVASGIGRPPDPPPPRSIR